MKISVLAFTVASANMATLNWSNMSQDQKSNWCKEEYWTFQMVAKDGDITTELHRPKECYDFVRGHTIKSPLMLFSQTRNYGCWCDFDNAFQRNSLGQPVNTLDRACMNLHRNYNLIQSELDDCNPRLLKASDDYTLPLTSISQVLDSAHECHLYNQNSTCGFRTCLAEAKFLKITYQPIIIGYQAWFDEWKDMGNIHKTDGGSFDYENQCNLPDGYVDEANDYLSKMKRYIKKIFLFEEPEVLQWFA